MARGGAAAAGRMIRREPGRDGPAIESPLGLGFVLISIATLGVVALGTAVDLLAVPVLAAAVIVLLGVPHGAFDVALARNRWDIGTPTRMAAFLAAYVGLAGTVLAIWALMPALALPCFLLVSGFHFAGDWEGRLARLPRLIVGTALITSPAVFHRTEVTQIFAWIVPAPVADDVPALMAGLAVPSLVGSGVLLATLGRSHVMTALEACAATALALFTEPLCFFVIYFCGLHSIRHMELAHRELRPRSIVAFFALSLPYAPLAIAGTVLGGWWLIHHAPGSTSLGAVFLSLAALTAPHMLLVDSRKPRTGPPA